MNKRISSFTTKELSSLNEKLVRSCEFFLGKKNGLSIKVRKRGVMYKGLYDYETKTIYLYAHNLPTVKSYIKTFIHEYAHCKQRGLSSKYSAYHLKYGYENNPFEVDANRKSERYYGVISKMVSEL